MEVQAVVKLGVAEVAAAGLVVDYPVIVLPRYGAAVYPIYPPAYVELFPGGQLKGQGGQAAYAEGHLGLLRHKAPRLYLLHYCPRRGLYLADKPCAERHVPGAGKQHPVVMGGHERRHYAVYYLVALCAAKRLYVPLQRLLYEGIQRAVAEDAFVQRPLLEFPPLGGPEAVGHEVVEGAGVVSFEARGGAEEGIPVQLKRKLVAEGLRGAAVVQGVLKALQRVAVFRFPGVPCVKRPQPFPGRKVVAVGAQLLRKAGDSPLRAYRGQRLKVGMQAHIWKYLPYPVHQRSGQGGVRPRAHGIGYVQKFLWGGEGTVKIHKLPLRLFRAAAPGLCAHRGEVVKLPVVYHAVVVEVVGEAALVCA